MNQSYRVEGMTCSGCAASVIKAIKAARATAEVEVDLEQKKITVQGFDDDKAIEDAVNGAGFEFGGRL